MKLEDIRTREDVILYMIQHHPNQTDSSFVSLYRLVENIYQIYPVTSIRDMLFAYSMMLGIDLRKR